MTKPLHAGLAASNGITAAMLGRSGLTADPNQLEASLGYFSLYGEQPLDANRLFDTLWDEWTIVARGLNIKRYPSCYDTSRTAEAALSIAPEMDPARITEVIVTVEPGGLRPLIHHHPKTGLEGKFSLEFVTAAALLDRRICLASFTDEAVNRPVVQELMSRVSISEQRLPPLGVPEWVQSYSVVRVRDQGGRLLECRRDDPLGHARRPLPETELADKFAECLKQGGSHLDPGFVFNELRHLRECASVAEMHLSGLLARSDSGASSYSH